MCNNSLFEEHGAENLPGLKHGTEDADVSALHWKRQIPKHKLQINSNLQFSNIETNPVWIIMIFEFGYCLRFDAWLLVLPMQRIGMVGEHSMCAEAGPVRACGVHGRENVGVSNRNPDENSGPRKSKVSSATKIDGG